jgi:hypothetical protein
VRVTSHTDGAPVTAAPSRLPTAPTTNVSTIAAIAMTTAERALATTMRDRCGTRVNVVSPVRWLHSLVTARIATSGRITTTGKRIAVAKVEKVS